MEDFNDILHFDPLTEAEKITGKSYTEDEATRALGLKLLRESNQRKTDELRLRNDLYSGIPFDEAVDIAQEMGFTPVYVSIVKNTREFGTGNPVHFYAFWRKGVLLTLESYGTAGEGRGLTVNSARITFNWRWYQGGTAWPNVPFSGGWKHHSKGFEDEPDDPWTLEADIDVRDGLKHYLDILEHQGEFLETWYSTPRIMVVHSYAERDDAEGHKGPWSEVFGIIDGQNLARINAFAEPARSAILAGRVGNSWED